MGQKYRVIFVLDVNNELNYFKKIIFLCYSRIATMPKFNLNKVVVIEIL